MTRRITIASHKGGVGKSTVTFNLAVAMRRLGVRVLIVEGDPEGGLTSLCRKSGIIDQGMVQVLKEGGGLNRVVVPLKGKELAILGTGIKTPEEVRFFEDKAVAGELRDLLAVPLDGFDYVLYDAPVGIGTVTRELLAASDSFIQVVDCRFATVRNMDRLLKFSVWVKKNINPALDIEGVLVNRHDPDSVRENKIYDRIKTRFPTRLFFKTAIVADQVFEKAATRVLPVEGVEGGRSASRNFLSLAAEIVVGKKGGAEGVQAINELDNDAGPSGSGSHSENGMAAEQGSLSEGDDTVTGILRDMCEKSGITGAVVADEMGFPLADYQCPLRVEALATSSSLLGESLKNVAGILEMPEVNNLVMDLNQREKMILHAFTVMGDNFFLILVCPQEVQGALGEACYAAERIADALSA